MPNIITHIDQLDPNGTYTYADYLMWQFQERLELTKKHIYRPTHSTRLTSPICPTFLR